MNNRQLRLLTSICKGNLPPQQYFKTNLVSCVSIAQCVRVFSARYLVEVVFLGIIVVLILVIDIALAIAGIIITVLDRNQINRMKQFGDISDLISRI